MKLWSRQVVDRSGAGSSLDGERGGGRGEEVNHAPPRARSWLDLRLLPAAVLTWVGTLIALGNVVYGCVLLGGTVAVLGGWFWWQHWRGLSGLRTISSDQERESLWAAFVLAAVLFAVALTHVALAKIQVSQHPLTQQLEQRTKVELMLTTAPKATEYGSFVQARVPQLPGRVLVFADQKLLEFDRGATIVASITAKLPRDQRPAISGYVVHLHRIDEVQPAIGRVAHIRQLLRDRALQTFDGANRLIPAMTLGDERGFTPQDAAMMTDSGLAHLSAVSGANFTLIASAVLVLVRRLGPRWRVGCTAVALAGFVALVGTEPSVLRALCTGIVALLAIVGGSRNHAIPALLGTIVVLLIAVPDLAASVGFALSVAATAGLVLVAEPVARRLAAVAWLASAPAPLLRAVAVAMVAHVATLPILALVAGRVSHISFIANFLAAPAVPPVTIFGSLGALVAAVGVLAPALPVMWLVDVCVWLAAPGAWWVYRVGSSATRVPFAANDVTGLDAVLVILLAGVVVWLAWLFPTVAVTAAVAAIGGIAAAMVSGAALGWDVSRAPPGWAVAVCPKADRYCQKALGVTSPDQVQPAANEPHQQLVLVTPEGVGNRQRDSESADFFVVSDLEEALSVAGQNRGKQHQQEPDQQKPDQQRIILSLSCSERVRPIARTPSGIQVWCPNQHGIHAWYPPVPADGAELSAGAGRVWVEKDHPPWFLWQPRQVDVQLDAQFDARSDVEGRGYGR